MELRGLDHVHFSVPELARAKAIFGPFLRGHFVDDYGGPEMNAYGAWNTTGGDFIQPIDGEKPVFGGAPMPVHGLLSVSFCVSDVDRGIEEARAHGLVVRSRVGSEDIGLGKNVVQAQLEPEPVSGLPFELVEHQLPGEYPPMTDVAVDHVELGVGDLDASVEALSEILGSSFEAECHDADRALRVRAHRGMGLRLTVPAGDRALAEAHGWRPGLSTIAFHTADLAGDAASAEREGLTRAREARLEGRSEIDFDPWAGVALRLVAR